MTGPTLWPDEIPSWLLSRRLPLRVLFGSADALLDYAREHGHPSPSLLDLDAARRRRRAVLADLHARRDERR